jgi:hypothetical protein
MIASTNQNKNQQTTEVNVWGEGDDGNGRVWLIARVEGKDSNDDQMTSADTTTAICKQQST